MLPLQAIYDAWNAFFFTPESALTLAVVRILIGTITTIGALMLLCNVDFFLGAKGPYPMEAFNRYWRPCRFSLFSLFPETNTSAILITWLFAFSAFCFTI